MIDHFSVILPQASSQHTSVFTQSLVEIDQNEYAL